jgi:transcription termination factor NusB
MFAEMRQQTVSAVQARYTALILRQTEPTTFTKINKQKKKEEEEEKKKKKKNFCQEVSTNICNARHRFELKMVLYLSFVSSTTTWNVCSAVPS